jgi:hypothetical protein
MSTISSAPVLGITHGVSGGTELPLSTCVSDTLNGSQERYQSSEDSQEIQHVPTSPILREAKEQTNNPDTSTSSAKLINRLSDPQSRTYAQHSGPHNGPTSLLSSERLPATLGYLSNRRNARASSLSTPTSSEIPTFTASSK